MIGMDELYNEYGSDHEESAAPVIESFKVRVAWLYEDFNRYLELAEDDASPRRWYYLGKADALADMLEGNSWACAKDGESVTEALEAADDDWRRAFERFDKLYDEFVAWQARLVIGGGNEY